jgi:mannose-6-phosphate isomerase-like protein (cupin superfamily)
MAKQTSRRNFLRTAPIAAAAGLTLTDAMAALAQGVASSGADVAGAAQPFQLWSAKDLAGDLTALDAKPGDNRLYESKAIPVQIVLTVEKHKSAAEFEWHEGRDHILQVLDGSTHYELGGTPTGIKAKAPGEWNSTGSTGSKAITLGKGDVLLIPRGTLHKRSTADSVTFLLISNPAPVKT